MRCLLLTCIYWCSDNRYNNKAATANEEDYREEEIHLEQDVNRPLCHCHIVDKVASFTL